MPAHMPHLAEMPPGASLPPHPQLSCLPATDEALDVIHSACGVHCGLVLSCVSYQTLAVCERHIGGGDAVTLSHKESGRQAAAGEARYASKICVKHMLSMSVTYEGIQLPRDATQAERQTGSRRMPELSLQDQ
jgi:hypothetical protein